MLCPKHNKIYKNGLHFTMFGFSQDLQSKQKWIHAIQKRDFMSFNISKISCKNVAYLQCPDKIYKNNCSTLYTYHDNYGFINFVFVLSTH